MNPQDFLKIQNKTQNDQAQCSQKLHSLQENQNVIELFNQPHRKQSKSDYQQENSNELIIRAPNLLNRQQEYYENHLKKNTPDEEYLNKIKLREITELEDNDNPLEDELNNSQFLQQSQYYQQKNNHSETNRYSVRISPTNNQRKLQNQILKSTFSYNFYKKLNELLPEGIIIFDQNYKIIFNNQNFLSLMGSKQIQMAFNRMLKLELHHFSLFRDEENVLNFLSKKTKTNSIKSHYLLQFVQSKENLFFEQENIDDNSMGEFEFKKPVLLNQEKQKKDHLKNKLKSYNTLRQICEEIFNNYFQEKPDRKNFSRKSNSFKSPFNNSSSSLQKGQ